MKQNYNLLTSSTAFPHAWNTFFQKSKTKTTSLLVVIFTLLGFSDAFGQTTEPITTTGAGTWIVPCGVTSITVEAWGAGGAGGGGTSNDDSGDGGGSGAYTSGIFAVTAGSNIAYTIGTGGVGSTNNGTDGGDTTILGMIAGGGQGGNRNGGTVTGTGGTATGGTINTNGNNGTAGGSDTGGNGGNAPNGGSGGTGSNNNNGNPGATPGGGGGGGERRDSGWFRDRSGGNGGDGQIRITYITSTPAVPANPTSNSPQCNPPGVTLTRVGTPPAGVTWYWQTAAGGTSTANSAATFVATTSGTYHLRAQNDTTGCWSAGSGSVAITVTPSLSAIAGTPAPTNAATGICYAGGSPLTSLTWNAVAGATSYDVYFGAGSLPGTAIANVATNSYTLGTLSASTTYYWQVVPRNACGATTGTPATWTFTTAAAPCVCVPTSANNTYPISNVTFAGINNNSSALAGAATPDYEDFSAIVGNVTAGNTYNISVTSTGAGGTNTFYQYVYFDWNNNGNFADDGGPYNLGNYTTATATFNLNITIPVTATIGTIKFRVVNSFNSILNPCATTGYFQMEDYSVTILAAPPCTEPTAQPTALVLTAGTPSGTALNGSFTAASPAPQNYLVVMNTTGTAPTSLIMDGTTYPIGSSIGVGNTVVDSDSNTTFTATGLNPSTTYYFYIYSLNALCTGGPLYNTNPTVLIGNATTSTGAPTYCTPDTTLGQNDNKYINRVAFIGTLVETNNTSTYSNATPGYQDFTGLAVKAQQAQGEGVNMIVESLGGRTRLHAWVDWNKNGTFESSEMVYGPATAGISSTFGFIVPSGAVPGDYRIRVRTYNSGSTLATENFGLNFDACQPFTTLSGEPQYGEAEDYLFTVIQRCDANIVSVTEGQVCNSGTVTLSATGTAGTTNYRWYASASGGAQLPGSPTTGSWTTPSISTTTTYYVTAWNGTCESLVRTPVVANVNTTPTLTFTPSAPETCGENNIISITATGDKELSTLLFENFESGGLGAFTNVNSDPSPANVKNDTRWTNRSSTFVPAVGISWKPAISSGLAPNNFALATSDSGTAPETLVENSLISGTLNSTGYLNLTMTMKFYYSRYFPDGTTTADEFVSIQISQTGGAPWTTLETFTADTGIGTKFADLTYNLNG